MSDVIKLLPDSVANQIAAGEVIQRPASVIKELVENSIDAGATMVEIIVKDAGRTLIQVVDNGKGMSPTDARLAFERHSTSKITEAADLFALHTMGFRGEALASICAVAQVDLRTMRKEDTVGTHIVISGSHLETQEPIATVPGCNFMIKNLFFNVPARRKFLKSDNVEMSHLTHEFERLALVNPGVEFKLVHNDVIQHHLLKGSFKQRIVELFGKALDRQLVPVGTDTSLVKIEGFVCRPENAKKRGYQQYMMVNGRNMRHPYFHKALMLCYEQLIPADHQPSYFLNFTVEPATIDVNIHPTKSEIKFENEKPIWDILVAAVREGLGKFNAVPSIDFDMDNAPEIPAFMPDSHGRHGLDLDTSYNPFKVTGGGGFRDKTLTRSAQDWDKLYESFSRGGESSGDFSQEGVRASSLNNTIVDESTGEIIEMNMDQSELTIEPVSPSVIQMKGRYIISPSKSGLMIVEQHRAHVRILYDRYLALAGQDALTMQRVIFPEVVQLTSAQNAVLESVVADVNRMGFDVVSLGDNSWTVNGCPSVLGNVNPQDLLLTIVNVSEEEASIKDDLLHKVALSMAHAAAVRIGQQLTVEEMDTILSDLFRTASPNYSPDGQRIITIIPTDDIIKMFG